GTTFSNISTVTSDDIGGQIPQRDATVTVLYADMNGNGSSDVVWMTAEGDVTYLELFPVRPNQLSRIDNGLGQVTQVQYGTSVSHMARDGGWQTWEHRLPYPMLVVDQVDSYDLLTDAHEVTQYRYHDGFYDGIEKQFRGYARVEVHLLGDDTQQPGLTQYQFDVGAQDPYTHGLMLSQQVWSDNTPLYEQTSSYGPCPLAEIPEGTQLPVKYICQQAMHKVLKEGDDVSQWATITSHMEYDGYGNVVLSSQLGVTDIGGQGCAACQRDQGEFGAPCGAQCVGDELYTQTDYVSPDNNSSGRWILRAPYRQVTYGRPGSALQTETLSYYDEGDTLFEGMALGHLDQGKLTRVTHKLYPDQQARITSVRNRFDAHGNVIETLDANANAEGQTHRRQYRYDPDNLRVVQADILLEDDQGSPYRLRREMRYEPVF
ncbi:MAG: toxin TcdB middle/N-terminal domain-containing protein, partial [Myxococcota bacterium]